MSYRKLFSLVLVMLCVVCSFNVFAHSGRTDSRGGHKDNKNASGLGSYHYHHGYSAHLHPNGVCSFESNTPTSSKQTSIPVPTPTPVPEKYIVSNDIRAKINDYYIPFYIYEDKGIIKVSDLNSYGFDTLYDSEKKATTVKRNDSKEFEQLEGKDNLKISIKESTNKVIFNVDGELKEINGFNADGNMYIWFSELEVYGTLKWDADNKVSVLNLD